MYRDNRGNQSSKNYKEGQNRNLNKQKSIFSTLIDIILKLVLVFSLLYIIYFFWQMHQSTQESLLPPEQQVIEPKTVKVKDEDTCSEYKTDIQEELNLNNLKDGEFIGYMIFPEVSDERWQIVNSDTDSGNVDNILSYSIAMDGDGQRLGTYGNTVMFGHNYLALKNIGIYEDGSGYIVIVIGNNTYVYEVYESKRISDTDVDYVYGLGDKFPYTYEEVINIINEVGVSDINHLTNDEFSKFDKYLDIIHEAGFSNLDLLTIYTCTQENLWSPITGRTVIKLKQVEQSNIC